MQRPTKTDKKSRVSEPVGIDDSKYPWGLSISLNHESIKKLGLDIKDLKAGERIRLAAEGSVTSWSMNAQASGKVDQNMSIQLEKVVIISDEADPDRWFDEGSNG